MTASHHSRDIDFIDALPLACLYAEDVMFVAPLREYLESNGCTVIINPQKDESEIYTIIAGGAQFVKTILAQRNSHTLRELAIVITSDPTEGQKLVSDSCKIIVIDPKYLTPNDVERIFSYFFSGTENFINLTRNIHEPFRPVSIASNDAPRLKTETVEITSQQKNFPHSIKNIEEPSGQMLEKSDTERIGLIMKDVFGKDHPSKKHRRGSNVQEKIFRHIFSFFIFFIFLFGVVIVPLTGYLGSVSLSSYFMYKGAVSLESSDIERTTKNLSHAEYWKTQSNLHLSIFRIPLRFIQQEKYIRGQERLLTFLSDASLGLGELAKSAEVGKQIAGSAIPSSVRVDQKLPASSIETLRLSIASSHANLGLAQAGLTLLLREKSFPFSLSSVHQKGTELLRQLESGRAMLTYASQVLDLYPKIAGFREKQSYLVLLQNSNELRPTGGFIGSVGVATFEDGTLSDFAIEDVYALDGQLKGHVEPPGPIAELLGNEHWYLRDSNWDPDFNISAKRAAWFYEKESGRQVDGVIAVNVSVLVSVLEATGPITLADYGDRITAENFFGKSIHYTQENFFPGSTQKKDFLGSLTRALMTKIMSDKDINGKALLSALSKGIESRDILVQMQENELQTMIDHFGWSGRVFTDSLCTGVDRSRCMPEQVVVSESNMSVSKVNNFVNHAATREITISPQGEVQERIGYTIGNTVNLESDPNARGIGGAYTTYLRFLVPRGSIVNSVSLDGVLIPSRNEKKKELPPLPYIENVEGEQDAKVIGVAVRIAPGERKEVQLSFSRLEKIPNAKGGAYLDLFWGKHPGISDLTLHTTVKYPLFWIAYNETASGDDAGGSFIAKDGQFEYNSQIQRDTTYRIRFIQ